jgi:hypothetical protein
VEQQRGRTAFSQRPRKMEARGVDAVPIDHLQHC